MADYRLNCCGGFPTCVCEQRRKEKQEREALAARGYKYNPGGYECAICSAVVNDMDVHTAFHRKLDHVITMNSRIG